jgi:hypothetical protein
MQPQVPPTSALNAKISVTLKLTVFMWMSLALAAVFVMTLGTDEAWVLNGLRSSLHPQVKDLSTELIVTSGGLFALLNMGVEWAVGSQVWVHRLLSLLALGGVFALVLLRVRRAGLPTPVRWLTLAPLMAVPGTIEIGTTALGTSIGLFLMVASMLVWSAAAIPLSKRIVYGGLLFGLAAASRYDLVLFGPAVLLVSSVRLTPAGRMSLKLSVAAWAFVGLGLAVFFLNQWAMAQPANATVAENLDVAKGLGNWALDYPRLLNQWSTLSTYAPLPLLALALLSAFWFTPETNQTSDPEVPRFEVLLAVTGFVLLLAWLFRAPIPHLRYAYPALFCFACLGAVGLQNLAAQSFSVGSHRHWLLCQCLGLAAILGSIGTTTRSLVMSDSDNVSWEWTHEVPYDYFRRFEAQQHQIQIASFLRNDLAPDSRLYGYVPYALRYLTERQIVAVDLLQQIDSTAQHKNRYLVLTPATGTYLYLNHAAANWLLLNTKLIKQIGRYSVYQLPDGSDADLEVMKLRRTNYEKHPGSTLWFGRE